MAKINLLTIHWGNSYGGTMQTYATVKILESLGHKVRVINLVHPKYNKSLLSIFKESRFVFVQTLLFNLFRKNHIGHFSKKMFGIDNSLIPAADYCVVGSDQVWNRDITSPIDMSYYLDFASVPKVSFSSSFGKHTWENDDAYTQTVKNALKSFKALSVREESGVKICKDVFGLGATQLQDPTILLADYDELVKVECVKEQIYPFLLVNNSQTDAICRYISLENKLPVYKASTIKSLLSSSPKSWLRRMKESSLIITDSFHGLAFSIIFNKDFYVLCANEKKFTRLHSLLKFLSLESRYIRSLDDLKSRNDILSQHIDYSIINHTLDKERQKGMDFLIKNLS